MDAIKFVNDYWRLCKFFENNCNQCPIIHTGCELACVDSKEEREEVVKIVEQWAKEHPVKTRQSEFLKHYPNAVLNKSGILEIDPCSMEKEYYKTVESDMCSGDCFQCGKDYWLEEI